MYPIEWDHDAISRKYQNTACWILDVNRQVENLCVISVVQAGLDVTGANASAPVIIYNPIKPDGTYDTQHIGYCKTDQYKIPSKGLFEIKIRPFSMKPGIIQGNHPENIFLFHRVPRKSFRAGVSGENFYTKTINSEVMENLDMAHITRHVRTPSKKVTVIDEQLYVNSGIIYAFNTQIGFLKGNEAIISSPVMRKLVAERAKTWQIRAL